MTKKEFKEQICSMTEAQKTLWCKINADLRHEINEREFETKAEYKQAMAGVYEKTIAEYLKR